MSRGPRTRRLRGGPSFGLLIGSLLLSVIPAVAGGPFVVNGNGEPLRWDTTVAIGYRVDLGGLGQLTQAEAAALVEASFATWDGVPQADLSLARGADLPLDVGCATTSLGSCTGLALLAEGTDDVSPVIFDATGNLIDVLFGGGASRSIVGSAALTGGSFLPPVVSEAEAVINGKFFDGISTSTNPELATLAELQAIFLHEAGHWLNLDHSQIDLGLANDGDPANDDRLPTMFPVSLDDTTQFLTLHADDVAALARLYPAAGFATSTGRLQGSLFLPDGTTLFQGANLVLRSTTDPTVAYSFVSGTMYQPTVPPGVPPGDYGGPPAAALLGAWDIAGIAPGSYTLEVEEVDPFFAGGSSVGPLLEPVIVPGPNEFWNDTSESGDPAVDDPTESAPLALAAGQVRTGVNLILNGAPPRPGAVLWAVDSELLFDPNRAGVIVEIDLALGEIVNRIPTPEEIGQWPPTQALAAAPSRGTLFYTDGFGIGIINEIQPDDGTIVNTLPWPAAAQFIEGLAFLDGPSQPPGGRLYVFDGAADVIIALDPDTGAEDPALSFDFGAAGINLFGGLGGWGDDFFATTSSGFIFRFRPTAADPFINVFRSRSWS